MKNLLYLDFFIIFAPQFNDESGHSMARALLFLTIRITLF